MKPKKSIYLDYAAATPLDKRVLAAMRPYLEENYANPSSLYGAARVTRQALDEARAGVARILGAKKSEVIFTAGATESINLGVFGIARRFSGSRVIASAIEHESVLACLNELKHEGYQTELVEVESNGIIDPSKVASTINDQTVLISVAYANSEIGTIQPIAKIARTITKVRQDRASRGIDLPIYLHTDASAAAGFLDLHVDRLGVDLITLNAGKIYGAKQSACLYVRSGITLKPLVVGGGQELGLRSGTEDIASAVGLAKALELAVKEREPESRRLIELRDYLIQQVEQQIEGVQINGHRRLRLPNNVNFSIPGIDAETAVLHFDRAGIAVATGSACTAAKPEPSRVLLAIGQSPKLANASLRITLGRQTTKREIDYFLKLLPDKIKRLRQLAKATRSG